MTLDPYITHTFQGLSGVNGAIEALHGGTCLRAVVQIASSGMPLAKLPTLKGNVKVEGGYMKQVTHWSEATQCNMTFSIFLPERKERKEADPPVLYYLSGKFE